MAEPFKNLFSPEFVREVGRALAAAGISVDAKAFAATVLEGWEGLELKERMREVSDGFRRFLPGDYGDQLDVLLRCHREFSGLPHLVFPDFVGRFGVEYPERSLDALEAFTSRSSSEFGVRPFLERDLEQTLWRVMRWTEHSNEHVRRLASEGTRPRLPWASPLRELIRDPRPALPVLDALADDPSEYVRRSVSNHLNDICKDHPEIALEWARRHRGESKERVRLLKHGLRTLLKEPRAEALRLFGYEPPNRIRVTDFSVSPDPVQRDGTVVMDARLDRIDGQPIGPLRVDMVLYFLKPSGRVSSKVFRLSDRVVEGADTSVRGRYTFTDKSTRRHAPGAHRLELRLNGATVREADFELEFTDSPG